MALKDELHLLLQAAATSNASAQAALREVEKAMQEGKYTEAEDLLRPLLESLYEGSQSIDDLTERLSDLEP
ncbi:MAG: hypothetical protein ACNA7W_21200 [Pseudomonadales bacterium]